MEKKNRRTEHKLNENILGNAKPSQPKMRDFC